MRSFLGFSMGSLLLQPSLLTSVTLLVVWIGACGTTKEPVSKGEIAAQLLNSGRYEEAIVFLEQELVLSPDDDQMKLRLASAYAGSVGFNLIDGFSALEPVLNERPKGRTPDKRIATRAALLEENSSPTSSPTPLIKEVERVERSLFHMAHESEVTLKVLTKLPYLHGVARDRLTRGIGILQTIPPSSASFVSGELYRGILSILQFLNLFRDSIGDFATNSDQDLSALTLYCSLKIQPFLRRVAPSLQHLTTAIDAFHGAGHSRDHGSVEGLRTFRDQLQTIVRWSESNRSLLATLDAANEASKKELCR